MVMNTVEIKNKILNDDEFASKIEYLLSKTILDNPPIHKTVFVYKKHKIILGKNQLYSIYDLNTKEKLFSGIHYQEVAKCIAKNIKNNNIANSIFNAQAEFFRFKNKIDFMKKSILNHYSDVKMSKLSSDIHYYNINKNYLLKLINLHK
jgi:hypothetical protein